MMFLQTSIIALIAIIGVANTDNLSFYELNTDECTDPEYRPWNKNGASTSWISLEGMGVAAINSALKLNVHDLRWLAMDNNQISTIPSGSFKFSPNLTYISLANNQIRKFENGAFDHLGDLRVLDLDGNPINSDFNGCSIFGVLPALRRLYLRNCHLLSFDLSECSINLSHLHLSGNGIQAFYATAESAITHLHLNDNQLHYASLAQFKSLVYLNLSTNWFEKILPRTPDDRDFSPTRDIYRWSYRGQGYNDKLALYLDDAPALKYLIISSNYISNIEPDIFLGTERLVHVDLSYNKISEIRHRAFDNLLDLEHIVLDSNKISSIHYRAFVNLPSLKIISLMNNQITDLSEDAFTKLNSNAPDLHLFLDNNRIRTLKRGSFVGINGLKHVGLSNNRIKTISTQTFGNLPNLESVTIENQRGDERGGQSGLRESLTKGIIESDAFFNLSNLTSLTIRGNKFAVVESQAFHMLPALRMLDLSNNGIENLSATAFTDLPIVESLYLEKNLISSIGPQTFPKQLKQLNLARNPLCKEFSCWHIGELYRLEKLNVSGIIEQFRINDVKALPENLTIVVGPEE